MLYRRYIVTSLRRRYAIAIATSLRRFVVVAYVVAYVVFYVVVYVVVYVVSSSSLLSSTLCLCLVARS